LFVVLYRSPYLLTAYTPSFFFHDTATTDIYTLSLHDALPIFMPASQSRNTQATRARVCASCARIWCKPLAHHDTPSFAQSDAHRSEEHTSELQSRENLVCRLLLEKKKKKLAIGRLHQEKDVLE